MSISPKHIQEAEERIRPHILETPLLYSTQFSERTGAHVYLKLENKQHTGSFKARGALNKILSLNEEESNNQIITASTGNHGLGFARALSIAGLEGTVYIPENAASSKIEALTQFPVELIMHGNDILETEIYAKQLTLENGGTWVSAYNDPAVIAGQGTIGIELTRQLLNIRAVYITVGGGGMISGIATWLRTHSPGTEIIGCLPENSPEMKLSVEAGHIVHLEVPLETLSDGSAGGMEDGAITFPLCQDLVSRFLLVSEEEIATTMKDVDDLHQQRIEGSAAVAVAAMLNDAGRYGGENVVAIVCGGNVGEMHFKN